MLQYATYINSARIALVIVTKLTGKQSFQRQQGPRTQSSCLARRLRNVICTSRAKASPSSVCRLCGLVVLAKHQKLTPSGGDLLPVSMTFPYCRWHRFRVRDDGGTLACVERSMISESAAIAAVVLHYICRSAIPTTATDGSGFQHHSLRKGMQSWKRVQQ